MSQQEKEEALLDAILQMIYTKCLSQRDAYFQIDFIQVLTSHQLCFQQLAQLCGNVLEFKINRNSILLYANPPDLIASLYILFFKICSSNSGFLTLNIQVEVTSADVLLLRISAKKSKSSTKSMRPKEIYLSTNNTITNNDDFEKAIHYLSKNEGEFKIVYQTPSEFAYELTFPLIQSSIKENTSQYNSGILNKSLTELIQSIIQRFENHIQKGNSTQPTDLKKEINDYLYSIPSSEINELGTLLKKNQSTTLHLNGIYNLFLKLNALKDIYKLESEPFEWLHVIFSTNNKNEILLDILPYHSMETQHRRYSQSQPIHFDEERELNKAFYQQTLQKEHAFSLKDLIDTYIKENVYTGITIQNIANFLHISRPTLYRKWSEFSTMSLNDYILKMRVEESIHLVTKKNFTLAQASHHMGFSSTPYFSKVFKKIFHMTPGKYLKSMK